MEYTREIYWNVGHGAWTLVPMYLLAIFSIGFLGIISYFEIRMKSTIKVDITNAVKI